MDHTPYRSKVNTNSREFQQQYAAMSEQIDILNQRLGESLYQGKEDQVRRHIEAGRLLGIVTALPLPLPLPLLPAIAIAMANELTPKIRVALSQCQTTLAWFVVGLGNIRPRSGRVVVG
jgi:hypothetical protein